jgi:hypothetical protein
MYAIRDNSKQRARSALDVEQQLFVPSVYGVQLIPPFIKNLEVPGFT